MAEQELKFKKLADVELVEEAPDTAHALAEIDGEIKRVAGGVGGGAGGYLVDATGDGALAIENNSLIITTPVPGLLDAAASGSSVTIKANMADFIGTSNKGYYCYIACTGCASYLDCMIALQEEEVELPAEGKEGYEEVELMKDIILSGMQCAGDFADVIFLNGHTMDELEEIMSTASLSTLSATPAALKLKGLKGGNAVAE